MTTTALSILSTLITVCGSAYPLGSNVLPRSPNRGDTNSSIRDKSAETDGLHNLSSHLQETYVMCSEKGNLTHLAKEDYLCSNYCSDKYLVYTSVEMITVFHRYLSRSFTPANIWNKYVATASTNRKQSIWPHDVECKQKLLSQSALTHMNSNKYAKYIDCTVNVPNSDQQMTRQTAQNSTC